MVKSGLILVLIINIFSCIQFSEGVPHTKLRYSNDGSPAMAAIVFSGNSMEESDDIAGQVAQNSRSIPLSSYIASRGPKTELNGGPIVFDEDYDEPLRPEPQFNDRNSFDEKKVLMKGSTKAPEIIGKKKPILNTILVASIPTNTKLHGADDEFLPIVFPSISSHTTRRPLPQSKSESPKFISSSTATPVPDKCVQTEDNDCDEIIIDGSIYAQLIYRTPESNGLRLRNRKMHKSDGFFLA